MPIPTSLQSALPPPIAERIPKIDVVHAETREDDYFWLREKADPKTVAYLNAENSYTDAIMAPTQPLQERLYTEILSHIEQTDAEVPYRVGDYYYYTRTEEGKQYPLYCRRPGSETAAEEITLDLNAMAVGLPFLSIGSYQVSDDGHLLLYTQDTTGFRRYTLQVKDLRTGEILADRIEKVGAVAWAADDRTLFYTVEDHTKRQYRLYRHLLGATEDTLIYEETDEMFNVTVGRSRSLDYLFLTSASHTASEVRYLDARTPEAEWKLVTPRTAMHEYYLDHHTDRFYILTNSTGINFCLVTAPTENPARSEWCEVVAHDPQIMRESLHVFVDHFVLFEREGGLPHLQVFDIATRQSHRIRFPEPTYSVFPVANREWNTHTLRYSYQSMVTPPSTFDYDLVSHTSTLRKQTHIPGGFEASHYVSERLFATAVDGVQVPISLVSHKDVPRDGSAPLYLYAYGSYGASMSAGFSSALLPLLDRGVVYAVAHIRGGGELGKAWHDAGRMFHKQNTFTDFIAAAEFLLHSGYGSQDRLVIEGASAGGLLMGAVTNMRPDLFHAVITKVPFVDVVNTMLDAGLPLTVGEYEEWGNPHIEAQYDYIKGYCPYTNLERKEYPAILVKTSFNDSQVMYWEPAKYVAKLRTLKTDSNPLLLKTNMAAGHGGASGRYDRYRETAFDYAFLLTETGIRE